MASPNRHRLFSILVGSALVLGACGPSAADAAISTAVEQTVEARFTQMAEIPTETPTATSAPSPTATATNITYSGSATGCELANLMGEDPPDGTIYKPGETFWKTWRIKNSSTCTWDATYKLVFWEGDLLGGAYVYNFPQPAIPGEIVDVTIQLWAPSEDGSYRGYWRLQSPSGLYFGVGEYDESLWVDIAVSSEKRPDYGVTNVTYEVVRNPQFGCRVNVWYTINGTITVSGPTEVVYTWFKSDNTEEKGRISFKEAGSKTVSVTWMLRWGRAKQVFWVMLHTKANAFSQDWGKQSFIHDCEAP